VILAEDGNVIQADFRPKAAPSLNVTITTQVLYQDERVVLMRTTASIGDKPFGMLHLLGDIATGQVIHT
jgi:hypothetical protein